MKSTILVLLLLLGAFLIVAPGAAVADQDGDYIYTTSGSGATITGYAGAGGAVIIPSTLGGYAVVAIGDSAFYNCTSLTSVVIPNSVTSLGNFTFSECTSLTSMTIPNSITSIGRMVFYKCTSLASVTIPGNVTSIGLLAFSSCTSLIAIDVNAGNANYASIDGVLYNKAVTTLIQCPSGKAGPFTIPGSVTSIGAMAFESCPSLTSVTMGSNVTSIGYAAFSQCTSLTSVTIPNSVTTIGNSAFFSCASLTSVTIGSSVTSIEDYSFAYCASMTSISFLGLVAPTNVGTNWLLDTPAGLRGHAYAASNFPAMDGVWNGLTMGAVVPSNSIPVNPRSDDTIIMVAIAAIALALVAVLSFLRMRKGKK